MREILFRGKRVPDGDWVEGFYFREAGSFIKELPSAVTTPTHLVYPETVGQYTGLTDKNGKKIFEGDIIKCTIIYDIGCYPHFKPEIREVKYIAGCFNPLYDCERNTYEVLGNIHDNPELLNN